EEEMKKEQEVMKSALRRISALYGHWEAFRIFMTPELESSIPEIQQVKRHFESYAAMMDYSEFITHFKLELRSSLRAANFEVQLRQELASQARAAKSELQQALPAK